MLLRVQRIAVTLAASGVTAFFFSATWMLWRAPNLFLHMDGTLTRTEATLSKARATLDNLDKGTKVWADSAKEQTEAIEDLATDAHGTLSEANRALQGVSAISQHVAGTADAATGLLASAQRTTDALPPMIGDARTVLQGIPPALAHFDALIGSPDLSQALKHVNGMTASGDGILADAKKIADKETADWLKPRPWWKAPLAKGGELIDIGAAIARHTP